MKASVVLGIALCCCMGLRPVGVSAQSDTGSVCQRLATAFTGPWVRVPAWVGADTSDGWIEVADSNGCLHLTARVEEARAEGDSHALPYAAQDLLLLNERDSAVSLANRSATRHPHDTETLVVLGALYEKLKEYRRAHCAYVRGVAADSADAFQWSGLARVAVRLGHAREALAYWAHVEQAHPGYLQVLTQPDFDTGLKQPLDINDFSEERELYLEAKAKESRPVPPRSASSVLAELPECLRLSWE